MAVLDYVPDKPSNRKTPSGKNAWTVRLVRTPKVIESIRQWAPGALLVAFKLEVDLGDEALRRTALASLRRYGADLMVANNLTGIRDEVHPALIIGPEGEVLARPQTKSDIARNLCRILAETLTR